MVYVVAVMVFMLWSAKLRGVFHDAKLKDQIISLHSHIPIDSWSSL